MSSTSSVTWTFEKGQCSALDLVRAMLDVDSQAQVKVTTYMNGDVRRVTLVNPDRVQDGTFRVQVRELLRKN